MSASVFANLWIDSRPSIGGMNAADRSAQLAENYSVTGAGTTCEATPGATRERGIASAPATVAITTIATAANTAVEDEMTVVGVVGDVPEDTTSAFAMAPKIATPTALPSERKKR